jgi:hypothetical protein
MSLEYRFVVMDGGTVRGNSGQPVVVSAFRRPSTTIRTSNLGNSPERSLPISQDRHSRLRPGSLPRSPVDSPRARRPAVRARAEASLRGCSVDDGRAARVRARRLRPCGTLRGSELGGEIEPGLGERVEPLFAAAAVTFSMNSLGACAAHAAARASAARIIFRPFSEPSTIPPLAPGRRRDVIGGSIPSWRASVRP